MRIPNKDTPLFIPGTTELTPEWFRWFQWLYSAVEPIPQPTPPSPPPPFSANIQFQDDEVDVGPANPRYVSFDANLTATYDAVDNRVNVAAAASSGGASQPTSFPECACWLDANRNWAFFGAISPGATTAPSVNSNDPVGWAQCLHTHSFASPLFRFMRQDTANARPTVQTNQINGRPVLRFDGVNDFLALDQGDRSFVPSGGALSLASVTTQPQGVMIFAGRVSATNSTAGNAIDGSPLMGDANGYFGMTVTGNIGPFTLRGFVWDGAQQQVANPTTIPLDTPFVASLVYVNRALVLRVDGQQVASLGSVGTFQNTVGAIRVGHGYSATLTFAGIDLLHAAYLAVVPTDDELLAMERYFGEQMGLSF